MTEYRSDKRPHKVCSLNDARESPEYMTSGYPRRDETAQRFWRPGPKGRTADSCYVSE
jgi:hypothetical protein